MGFRGGGVLWAVFFVVVYNNCIENQNSQRLIQRGPTRYKRKNKSCKCFMKDKNDSQDLVSLKRLFHNLCKNEGLDV